MRFGRFAPRRGLLITLILAVVSTACTNDQGADQSTLPDPKESADAFVEAWNSSDGAGMAELLAADATVTRSELAKAIAKAPGQEVAQGFDIALTEEIEVPEGDDGADDLAVPAPYEISYEVPDFDDVSLAGELELLYEPESETWDVVPPDELMFPGVDGGVRLELEADWPRRGTILDRNGRPIAKGNGLARTYPFGSLAGSSVGHIERVTTKTIAEVAPGHEVGDLVGGSGLEEAYEERLSGQPDLRLRVVNRKGKALDLLEEAPGASSKNLRATLDMRVQQATSNAFGSTVGGTVVLEPNSGDILAAVSSSEIDPNGYVGAVGVEPFNRALSGTYPPGSSMKVVTAGAALDTGVVKPSTQLTGPAEYQGVRNFESGAYASLDFASAVRFSVNTAFAQVALDLGAKRLIKYAKLFGFNREPVMPLEAARSSFPFPENAGDLMWGSIGQAQDLATPLQMASVVATVANDGVRMEPRSSLHDPKEGARVLSKKTATELSLLMEGAVNGGTGTNARISGVRVAGKTGTAEVDVDGERKNHAWFVTFAPVEAPALALSVVSELGGIGGQVAAPIAQSIYTGVLPLVQ